MTESGKKKIGWLLTFVFLLALVFGSGPGMLLVNRPDFLTVGSVKIPFLYAWGLLWYLVEALCIVIACVWIWRTDGDA